MKYPAKEHARTVASHFKARGGADKVVFYVAAAERVLWPHSDQDQPIRQNRYFNYLSGAHDLADAHVIYNPSEDKLVLYLPVIDEKSIIWSGMPMLPEEALERYDVDEVKYANEIPADVNRSGKKAIAIDPSPKFQFIQVEPALQTAFDNSRVIKDDYEIKLLRKAAKISDYSHLAVMSALPIEKNEGHIHAEFVYHSMRQGAKLVAYDPICCSGTSCGVLHYVKNDQDLDDKQLVLIDAGAEWESYASDVTRVFPINGEWTKEARAIYDLVFHMQAEALKLVKPGAFMDDLHLLAHRLLVEGFLKLGIFKDGTVDEIYAANLSAAFYPHGLGHMLGMDTHDVGGEASPGETDPKLRHLRIRRPFEKNMYITIEPGVYFNNFLIKPLLENPEKAKFVDKEVLESYMPVGGVRIEDDVLVTSDSYENFTKITKDADEISRIVKDGIRRGRSHFHCLV